MIEEIAKDMALTVKQEVEKVKREITQDYEGKLAELSAVIEKLSEPKEVLTIDEVRELLDEEISKIEIDMPDISHLEKQIAERLEALKDGEDGKDGVDGKDGENGNDAIAPTADEVAKSMEGLFSTWALGFERKADELLQKSIDKFKQPENGKDGRDAIELDDFDIELSEDSRTVKMSLKRGEDVIEKSLKIPTVLDRGVYRHGDSYEKGDFVTYGGSGWIAQKDEPESKPSTSDEWRLSVKKGRDGRESVKIERQKEVSLKDSKNGEVSKPNTSK